MKISLPVTVAKARNFGPNATGFTYTVEFAGAYLTSAPSFSEASTRATLRLSAALAAQENSVIAAVAKDGTVLTLREYSKGEYELRYHRGESPDGVLQAGGSELGKLQLDGRKLTAREFLAHRLSTYNKAC